VALAAPVGLLTIPILDTAAAIIRRKLTGRSIATTDRGHLHHCLLRHGLSRPRVLLCVSLLCLVTAGSALASLTYSSELLAILTALAVASLLVVTRLFGYAEYSLVKARLFAVAAAFLQRRNNGKSHLTEVRLQGSVDWGELWRELRLYANRVNLQCVCLDVNAPALHEGYHARWFRATDDEETSCLWRAEIPLSVCGQIMGHLEIAGEWDEGPVWRHIAGLARLMEEFEDVMTKTSEALSGNIPAQLGSFAPVNGPNKDGDADAGQRLGAEARA
jgi:UDP-GlcNAc:undecaprenyl-phosphate GlcNAc-1-phosphate transferase